MIPSAITMPVNPALPSSLPVVNPRTPWLPEMRWLKGCKRLLPPASTQICSRSRNGPQPGILSAPWTRSTTVAWSRPNATSMGSTFLTTRPSMIRWMPTWLPSSSPSCPTPAVTPCRSSIVKRRNNMSIAQALTSAPVEVSFPGIGIENLPVSRVAFSLFGVPVYWYGLLIATAIILSLFLSSRQADKFGLKSDDILDIYIYLIPAMIVFARIYYVIFEWDYYNADWRRIFNTREGGLAFYGGVIGGALAIILVAKFKKIKIADILDFIIVYVPLAQAIGRWGNFFNQEAFGTNTTLPWGMISSQTSAYLANVPGADAFAPVHPTFLYEFIGNLVLFFILLKIRSSRRFSFQVLLTYLLGYGIVRFFVEGIRTDALFIGDTSWRISQVLSAVMVVVSVVLIVVLGQKAARIQSAQAATLEDFVEILPLEQAIDSGTSEAAATAPAETSESVAAAVATKSEEESQDNLNG
ncbi:MAG: prolipoprotein diacylglyceryl transferase [Clostridia bacterium]|nr:prolipoprotein diacylglyceryl transferase [Clostridia bacterium]